jgi:hypothetical protein
MLPASPPPRPSWTALPMAAPVVAAACWITWAAITPGSPRANADEVSSLARAVQHDQIEAAFRFIQAGADPNAPVAYRHERLTGGRDIAVPPLLIAVAHARDDSVKMLVSSGVRLDAPGNRLALCLARQMDHARVAATLLRYGGPAIEGTACPNGTPPDGALLRAYVE